MNASFSEIAEALKNAENILVASHIRPDGDALGSTIAFALWLKAIGKNGHRLERGGSDPKNSATCRSHEIISIPDQVPRDFDVLVALDNSVKNRLGTVLQGVPSARTLINIDHHISNEAYGALNYIDPTSPATGQILYEFFKAVDGTSRRRWRVISLPRFRRIPVLFNILGRMFGPSMRRPDSLRPGWMSDRSPERCTKTSRTRRLELLRHALNQAKFACDGHLASFSLSACRG